jgi:hypothetical protein
MRLLEDVIMAVGAFLYIWAVVTTLYLAIVMAFRK